MTRCLVAGPGGAGSSTVARAAALAAARQRPTVLVTADPTDPARPADGHGHPDRAGAGPRLRTVRPDSAAAVRRLVAALHPAADPAGRDAGALPEGVTVEELADLPGVAELALLVALTDVARGTAGEPPAVVVDAGARAVPLLALTERLGGLLDAWLPPALRILGGVARGVGRDPLSGALDLLEPGRALLDTAVAVVVEPPEPTRAEAARRLVPQLALFGIGTALVVPSAADEQTLAGLWRAEPGAAVQDPPVVQDGDGYRWALPLPGAARSDLDLQRDGDDLVVGVHGVVRRVPLPSLLARCTVVGAGLEDGALVVRFVRDPARWPTVLPGGAAS